MTSPSKLKTKLSFYSFVLPAFIFYLIFMAIPTFGSLIYSFTSWNGLNPHYHFTGLANYYEAFVEDSKFKASILFSFNFSLVMVVLQNALALLVAVLISALKRSRKLFRTIFFLPNMISLIVGARMLKFIFVRYFPDLGQKAGIFSILNQPWSSDPFYAFISIIIVTLWAGLGYTIVIYLAAIETVPKDLREQSLLDGASVWQRFYHITVPMIMPAITICVFMTLNSSLKAFDQIFGMTNGGPGWSTATIGLNLYYDAFAGSYRMGYGCAKAIILFVMILVLSIIQISLMKSREVEL